MPTLTTGADLGQRGQLCPGQQYTARCLHCLSDTGCFGRGDRDTATRADQGASRQRVVEFVGESGDVSLCKFERAGFRNPLHARMMPPRTDMEHLLGWQAQQSGVLLAQLLNDLPYGAALSFEHLAWVGEPHLEVARRSFLQ